MQNKKWQLIKSVFDEASRLSKNKQKDFVIEHSQGDEEVRNKVLSMLATQGPSESALQDIDSSRSVLDGTAQQASKKTKQSNDNPESSEPAISLTKLVAQQANSLINAQAILAEGTMIEHFKVHSLIGEGGMGSVFLGLRSDTDFEQRVAIKVIHKQHANQQSIQRFKRERQILASLNHKHIASLVGGGETDSGLPYIILEYVEGVPITEYCQTNDLSVGQRLQLFKQVLSALNYAHQNLVVHRDIKPNNVLVTAHGDVKLLDFGIAKLLQNDSNDKPAAAHLTQHQMRILTPSNASPEQVLGERVTTRTDVYGLGTLLMHMLTDEPLFDITERSSRELESMILEQTPSKPSVKCKASSKQEVRDRAKVVRGDIDTIVLKALQKDPDRRYSSVEQIQEDITRYESNYPILATPDSLWYRSQKFIRRNTIGTALSTILLATLLIFSALVNYQSGQIAQQRDAALEQASIAQQTADFMTDMFKAARPDQNDGLQISAMTLLEKAQSQIDDLDASPSIKAKLLLSIATVYTQLDEFELSLALLDEAFSLKQAAPFENTLSRAILDVEIDLERGGLIMLMGEYNDAISIFTSLLGKLDDYTRADIFDLEERIDYYMAVEYELSNAYGYVNDAQKASESIKRAIDYALMSKTDPVPPIFYISYGQALRMIGEHAMSVESLQKSVDAERKNSDVPSLDLSYALLQLAASLDIFGNIDAALIAAKESLQISSSILGEAHNEAIAAGGMVSNLYSAGGNYKDAIAVRERMLLKMNEADKTEHPYYAMTMIALANIYKLDGQLSRAETEFKKGYERIKVAFKDGHFEVARPLIMLAEIALLQNRVPEAKDYLQQAQSILDVELEGDSYLQGLATALSSVLFAVNQEKDKSKGASQQAKDMFIRLYGQDSKRFKQLIKTMTEVHDALALPQMEVAL